jgi:acetyl-CoA carboxylase biotin carboxyl carrier protein
MKDIEISLNDLKQLTKWVNDSGDIRELSLSYNGIELFISRNENTSRSVVMEPSASVTPDKVTQANSNSIATPVIKENKVKEDNNVKAAKPSSAEEVSVGENEHLIVSPMVGTFYKSPAPGAPSFVEIGQEVEPKTIVCIIEVMKLMNNLEAKFKGRVKEIYVEDQQAVEFGQPIMLIEKE